MTQDKLLTRKQLAKKLGVSIRTVARYLSNGMPSTQHDGKVLISLNDGIAWKEQRSNLGQMSRREASQLGGSTSTVSGVTQGDFTVSPSTNAVAQPVQNSKDLRRALEVAKLRRDEAQADKAELERDIKRGQYFPADRLKAAFAKLGVDLHSRLIGFAGRAARDIATKSAEAFEDGEVLEVADLEELLTSMVEGLLADVSDNFRKNVQVVNK